MSDLMSVICCLSSFNT